MLNYNRNNRYSYFYLDEYYEGGIENLFGATEILSPASHLPQTALSEQRSSALTVRGTRASTAGGSENEATGQDITAVGASISGAVWGSSQGAMFDDKLNAAPGADADRFAVVDEPRRYAGASSSGVAFGRSNPLQQPGTAKMRTGSQANVNLPLPAGAVGDTVGYASGSQYSGVRSQVLGITGHEFIDFDIAG